MGGAEDTEIEMAIDDPEIQMEDVHQAIIERFKYAGGSARWMFNYTNTTIDGKLKEYCDNVTNRTAVLNGDIGPTSSESSNVFFGSRDKNDGETEYFLVSQRAVEVLREKTDSASFRTLYDFAGQLQNP